MKRLIVFSAIAVFFVLGIGLLLLFSHNFAVYTLPTSNLWVKPIAPREMTLGKTLTLDLRGQGFDDQTTVSLLADVSHREAVIGTFPLDGVYNGSLLYRDHLYLTCKKGGIQVLDVKNRVRPHLLKGYLSDRTIIDIHRHGDTLYLSCGSLGVAIMTIAADGSLIHLADIVLPPNVWKTRFVGGYLYVAAGTGGFLIYDIRNPEQAKLVEKIAFHFSTNFTLMGDYLYLAAGNGRVSIYNIVHPEHPAAVGALIVTGKLHDLTVFGRELYVATETGVYSYQLLRPETPQLMRKWNKFGSAEKIFPGEDCLYVSDSFSGFRIIDPAANDSSEFINLNVNPHTMTETEHYLYVAGIEQGLLIVDKKMLRPRSVMNSMNTAGSAHDLLIREQCLYVADAAGGLLFRDLREKNAPFVSMSKLRSESLAAAGDLLFVAQGWSGIEVFDISDPIHPAFVTYWAGLQGWRLAADGRHLVVAKGVFGVDLMNITAIDQPRICDSLHDIHPLDIALVGDLVYIVSKDDGLLIYRLTEDEKLKRLSQLATPFPMNRFDMSIAIQVKDGIAYIANGRAGLLIVDVRHPASPEILSSTAIPGICKGLQVVDEQVYTVSHRGGINIVNVSDLRNPVVVNTFPVFGVSRGIEIDNGLIYVAHNAMGVTTIPTPVAAKKVDMIVPWGIRAQLPSPRIAGYYSVQIRNRRTSVVLERAIIYKK